MAGWDEGNVFYSEQFGVEEDPDQTGLSRDSLKRKLKEFIRSFNINHGTFIYRDKLQVNPAFLEVSLEDLTAYDDFVAAKMMSNPTDVLPLFEAAAAEVLAGLQSKVPGERGDLEEPTRGEVPQLMLSSKGMHAKLRDLSAAHISKLVKVPGIVIAASRTKAKATAVTLICKNCRNTKVIPCKPGLAGVLLPRSCDRIADPLTTDAKCPLDPWVVVPEKSKYVDQQTLKLQENPEAVPIGELPRNLLLSVDRNLVQKIVPGTRVSVIGIYSIFQSGNNSKKDSKTAVAIRQPYLRVVGIEQDEQSCARGFSNFTVDEELEFKEFSRRPNAYEELCKRVAPSIFGHEDVKKAVACQLFGGSRKLLPDGVRLRGDINVLLLGDPSTAKSQFLKFVEKTAPVAVYTSGKGSSAAGLTASVIKDYGSGEFYLEVGAMVLADGGVVCIDEFDKMRPEDRVAIHEAMEQQTISIAKAGITTVLNSRTSVLAAANPPSGRYDDLKTAQENIDLQTTILSRFDLIFIVKDARDHARDMLIARHVVNLHATADMAADMPTAQRDLHWLKRYVEYCRTRCFPRLSEEAATVLQNNYVKIRQQMRQRSNDSGEAAAIPITVRQLEAIVRLSEALARMQLLPVATVEHAEEALRLFRVSTIDAASSGIADNIIVTPEQRAEIQQIESQIKRRLGIGSFMSERRMIDDLTRMGMSESSVRRAILVMAQRDELEYRREHRVIFRKA